METIALTAWNEIVSPLYDASCSLLIVRPDGRRSTIDIRQLSLFDKAALCSRESVNVVICGAISDIACAMLQHKGIKVYAWIRGPLEAVIAAYRLSPASTESFAMPGCRRRMHGNSRALHCPAGRRPRHPR